MDPDSPHALLARLTSLEEVITQQQAMLTTLSNSGPTKEREPKLASPEFYTGNRKKSRAFLLQLRNVFYAQPDRFRSDQNKVAYAISFLRDTAFAWVAPLVERNSDFLSTFERFAEHFLVSFGDTR